MVKFCPKKEKLVKITEILTLQKENGKILP